MDYALIAALWDSGNTLNSLYACKSWTFKMLRLKPLNLIKKLTMVPIVQYLKREKNPKQHVITDITLYSYVQETIHSVTSQVHNIFQLHSNIIMSVLQLGTQLL